MDLEPIRILIAEDFDLLREDLEEALNEEADFVVVGTAASGAEIVKLAEKVAFDIILMDVEMESARAGIEAAEKIIGQKPHSKIIFLTAHETEEMILASMSVGPVDYIVKSADYEKLFDHIRGAFQGRPVLSQEIQQTLLQEYSRLREAENSLLFFINNVSKLTNAEVELVNLLLKEKKVKEIAEIRHVEVVTVKTQINSLLKKFGCTRTKQIVKMIRDHNLEDLFEQAGE